MFSLLQAQQMHNGIIIVEILLQLIGIQRLSLATMLLLLISVQMLFQSNNHIIFELCVTRLSSSGQQDMGLGECFKNAYKLINRRALNFQNGIKRFEHDWPWIQSISNELDITIHMIASQLSSHCDVISNRLWHHQQNENRASKTRARYVKILFFRHSWIRYVM